MIRTKRLDLIPATTAVLEAELQGPAALAEVLAVEIPESWPPELYDSDAMGWMLARLAEFAEWEVWGFRYFVLRRRPPAAGLAVGAGGFNGAPTSEGDVEIGYSILPEYQRRGFAREAVEGLKKRAYRDARVLRIVAETLPDLEASIGVLRKTGFELVGDGSEPGVVRFEHRRRR